MNTLLAASILLPVATLWVAAQPTQDETDPNKSIKKRLSDFIQLADSVDFDASAELQDASLGIVQGDFRIQSDEQKLLSRLGRDQVLDARDQARTLLFELGTSRSN